MDRRQTFRKIVALLSAVLLVAAFVLYRAGVIGPLYMSSSKSTFIFVGSGIKPTDTSPTPETSKPALAPPPRPVD